jgi:hypothetical protein
VHNATYIRVVPVRSNVVPEHYASLFSVHIIILVQLNAMKMRRRVELGVRFHCGFSEIAQCALSR